MTSRHDGCGDGDSGGLSAYLRGLLSGVPWSESASGEQTLDFDVPSKQALRIHNPNGRTRIVGEDRDDIEVRIDKHARAESVKAAQTLLEQIEVVAEDVDGALELDVRIPRKWNRYGAANLEVLVPRTVQILVTAANGKMCLSGLRNTVCARSANGSVTIGDVVGDIEVSTANSPVCCSGTCGRLVARSSNGKIELSEHSGSLDASTSNGLIRASLIGLGREGVVLATSNGRIVLELPDEVDAEVDVRVENGIIRNQRKMGSQADPVAGRLRGRLGKGGTPIKLRTSNGVISLR